MASRPRVFVSCRLPPGALARLEPRVELDVWERPGPPSPAELARRAEPVEGLLCLLTDRVDAALLAGCPALRVVSSISVGLDHVDVEAATSLGIPVGHTPGVLAETTADLAFALLLAAARRVVAADRTLRAGGWTRENLWQLDGFLGRDVHGAVLGVVGLGAIGRAVAARARGFGMRVLGWSRTRRELEGIEWSSLEELLARADFVSIHVALVPETRGLLDAAALARMKPEAMLVNTARGGIVDEDALAAALVEGRLAGAALDVFASEPLDPASPLLAAPNLVLTPHIGSASVATRGRMAELAVDNLLAGLEGRSLPRCANPDALAAARALRAGGEGGLTP